MDFGFARRRKANLRAGTPDLSSLLAGVSARQAGSPTARTQAALAERVVRISKRDARVDLFAAAGDSSHVDDACFSRLPDFTPRQSN